MSRPPNVVWVTLDSVRQDHTTMGGHERDTTPRLAAIAERSDGRAFDRCFAHGIWTLASSAAILTGTAPSHNTVGMAGDALPESVPTVAELFGEVGYETACLSRNSYLSPGTGLDRGFDRFEWVDGSRLPTAVGLRTTLKYLLSLRRHSAGYTTDTAKHATPFVVNDVAKRWLRSFAGNREPFFLYLHYNEPHRPFYPPNVALDRFADDLPMAPREAAEFALSVHRNNFEHIADGVPFTDDEWRALEVMYDSEIAYTDECVGRLHEAVRDLDLGETIFVVTADHGEFLGEHGLLSHKYSVHDAVVNVPCVAAGLGDLAVDRDDVVQHADVVRTVLERAGARTDSLQGVDLRETGREFAVVQRHAEDFDEVLEHDPEFPVERFHASRLTALRTRDYKYLESADGSALYRPPDEETDLFEEEPDVRDDLAEKRRTWLETDGRPAAEGREAAFTDEMRDQLSDLGYI